MSTPIEISDDDDSFEELSPSTHAKSCVADDSSGLLNNTTDSDRSEPHITSDDDDEYELPSIALQEKKKAIIKNLFPAANAKTLTQRSTSKVSVVNNFHEEVHSNIQRMIGGIQVTLPVNPYGSQIALMSKVITAIKKGQNCLLESPTGSGKTLALLCGALAWHRFERNRITQIQSEDYFSNHPDLMKIDGVAEYIGTPHKKNIEISPEKLFSKVNFARVTCAAGRGRGGRHCGRWDPASGRRVAMATTPRHPKPPDNPKPYPGRATTARMTPAQGPRCSLIYPTRGRHIGVDYIRRYGQAM